MTPTYYTSLPKVDSAISTPTSSPTKRWTTIERSSSSVTHAIASSMNSAKTTIGNKARFIIPKIAQLTTPVKKKSGGVLKDEASTPVLFYPDEDAIDMKHRSAASSTTLVDPFSFEGRAASPSSSSNEKVLPCDDFSFRPTQVF